MSAEPHNLNGELKAASALAEEQPASDYRGVVAPRSRRPEILAPAGNMEMMRAAVENGADAIYFGLEVFNARLRAHNFTIEELPATMAWLHERGVKGFVTLNTLVFPSEMEEAAWMLLACSDAGVDAVIVQDLGVAALAARLVPDLPMHASTQMTLTSAESIAAAEALGLRLERIVAPRENNVRELARMARESAHEIEVFVHGAICVAYSGQCLTSEALGGRSANRGECAQACRLPYDLVVDGEPRDLGDVKYLLSPKDLAAWADLDKLAAAGIASLKIEGRLKSPRYVAAAVQSYRAALDSVFGGDAETSSDRHLNSASIAPHLRERLEMTFSRGFTPGYVHETNHQAVVEGRFPKKRGLFLGTVASVDFRRGRIRLNLKASLKPGDGVVFDAGRPDENESGGRVTNVITFGKGGTAAAEIVAETEVHFDSYRTDLSAVRVGDRVWKTSDPELDRELIASYAGEKVHFRRAISAVVRGRAGEPLKLTLRDKDGLEVRVLDRAPAEPARERPLTRDTLYQQLSRLGDTPFELAKLTTEICGDIMVPFSRLNELRRRAVEALLATRRAQHQARQTQPDALAALRTEIPKRRTSSTGILPGQDAGVSCPVDPTLENNSPVCYADEGEFSAGVQLSVLCRTLDQVRAAAAHPGVSIIYADFEDLRKLKDAREIIPRAGAALPGQHAPLFAPATLRVIKPGEIGFTRRLLDSSIAPDAILVRNLASWRELRRAAPDLPLFADYSLNIANDLTATLLRRTAGFAHLTPSYDLNADQLLDLLNAAPADWFEITIHQRIPMFHMEHCVFCRFLSSGTNYTNCGRPCDTHSIQLRDRVGFEHPVKADAGCRNTVYNAVAQSASEYLPALLSAGAQKFRIELLDESADETRQIIDAYLPAVRGEIDGRKLWRQLRASSKLGVTRGSLDAE